MYTMARPCILLPFTLLSLSIMAQPGSLDLNFSGDGFVFQNFTSEPEEANVIMTLPNGRILVAGAANIGSSPAAGYGYIARYMPDEGPDPSFGNAGMTTTEGLDIPGSTQFTAMDLDPHGRIVVVYNSDGTLYSDFNGNGTMVLPIAQFFEACRIIATTDGGLLVTGVNGDDLFMWKLHADGSLDTSFSFNGMASTNIPDHSGTTFFIPGNDGSFFACVLSGGPELVALHYRADGSLDTDFGTNGIASTPIGEDHDRFVSVHALADGRIIMVLLAPGTDDGVDRLLMLRPDGSPDESYGPGVVRSANADPTTYLVNSLFQPDGKLVLGGMKVYVEGGEEVLRPSLTRLDQFMLPDPSFGDQGTVSLDVSEFTVAEAPSFRPCALQPDGRILAVCSFHTGLSTQILVARYLNDLSTAVEEDGIPLSALTIRYDPSADAIHVRLPPERPTTQLRIHDARGALVRVVGTGSRNTVIIPLAGLSNGIHLITSDGPSVRSSSFIINHH